MDVQSKTQVCRNFIPELQSFQTIATGWRKTLSEEEKQRINALLEKHRPREEIQEKEMIVLSEKGKEISN